MSAIAHCILLIGLVMARAQGKSGGMSEPVATRVVYIAPKPQQPASTTSRPPVGSSPQIPDFPRLPPVILDRIQIDNVLNGTRLLGEIVTSFATTGFTITRDTLTPAHGLDDVLTALTVEQPVELIPGQRPPRYPFALERAGITGDVVARFVVDTTGRVERASVDIQQSTHAEFARAVQERLSALRFVPARARGHAVRQLVEQRFHFEIVRR